MRRATQVFMKSCNFSKLYTIFTIYTTFKQTKVYIHIKHDEEGVHSSLSVSGHVSSCASSISFVAATPVKNLVYCLKQLLWYCTSRATQSFSLKDAMVLLSFSSLLQLA